MTRTKYQSCEAVEINRSEIKNAPYNPRSINPQNRKRLSMSIKKHGLVDVPVWNVRTGNIVGGHQRVSAIDDLEGGKDYTLTVQKIDVDETQERQLNIALNNPTMQGQWEADMLKEILADFIESGVDVEPTGYSTFNVQTMYPDIFASGDMADQAEAEFSDVNTIAEMAEVGKNREADFRREMGLDDGEDFQPPAKTPGYDEEGGQASWADQQPQPPQDQPPPPEHEERGWTKPKEYFEGKRQGVLDRNTPVLAETDCMVTLSFQTRDQLIAFLATYGLDQSKRYFDLIDVETAFGVELPR